jgi:hypothetical protein
MAKAFVVGPLNYCESFSQTSNIANRITVFAASDGTDAIAPKPQVKPDILQPFLPAADPLWMCRGPVGEGEFVVTREGGPTVAELANENILRIVRIECSDLEVNTLVWKCMGYRFDPEKEEWIASDCFPNWRERYPTPPDFIGMRRM